MNPQKLLRFTHKSYGAQFALNLQDHFLIHTFSDVTLVSDENVMFKAHKFAVILFSPVRQKGGNERGEGPQLAWTVIRLDGNVQQN